MTRTWVVEGAYEDTEPFDIDPRTGFGQPVFWPTERWFVLTFSSGRTTIEGLRCKSVEFAGTEPEDTRFDGLTTNEFLRRELDL